MQISVFDTAFVVTDGALNANLELFNLLDGDTVVVCIAYEDTQVDATEAVPSISGFTTIQGDADFGGGLYAFYKVISGNTSRLEIPVVFSQTCDASLFAFYVRDPKVSAPIGASSYHANGGTSNHSTTAVTSVYDNSIIVCVAGAASAGTGYGPPANFDLLIGTGRRDKVQDPAGAELTVSYKLLGAAGLVPAITFGSFGPSGQPKAANSQAILIVFSPSQAPSRPTVVAPVAGESITVGRTYTLQCTQAVDPAIAPSSLTYEWEYNINGTTWVSIGTTSAGVLTKSWNTTGLTPSSIARVRVRANNGTDNGPWGESGVFSLLANVSPGKPINLSPVGVVNKGFAKDFTWTHVDIGDPQKSYELQYSSNADMSSPTSTGEVTSSTSLKNFAANTGLLATAGTRYWQVRTKGQTDSSFGPWADPVTVQISTPPAQPNITAPTNASPPTTGKPTGTFTSGGHQQYRYRLVKSGVQVYDSGWIASPLTSFVFAISLVNLGVYTLYLAVKDSTGLESTEDSETFTVTYTGPAKPTLTVTNLDSVGGNQLVIVNSDSPTKQHVLRKSASEVNYTRISPDLAPDTVWLDTTPESGIEYTYIIRAYVSTGGFTDSDPETATLNLDGVFISRHTKTSTTSNAVGTPLNFSLLSSLPTNKEQFGMMRFKGRTKEVAAFGRGKSKTLQCQCRYSDLEADKVKTLEAALENEDAYIIRTSKAIIKGKISKLPFQDFIADRTFSFVATQEDFTEEVTS